MSVTTSKTLQAAKADGALAALYRPIGLKAVTAAHLMLKDKSAKGKKSA